MCSIYEHNTTMKLLDCTLRDGGYYTNWNFSSDIVEMYLQTVSKLPISYVEIGYLSDVKDNNGPFYHLNYNSISFAKKILRKDQKVYAMVNTKEIKNIKQLTSIIAKTKGSIDGVRFAVDPHKVIKFLKILDPVKKKFPKISFNINLMYLSKWHMNLNFSKKIINLLSKKVDVISIVDSFGSMLPQDIKNFLKKINYEKKNMGCHFHNNCGLALASTLTALDNGCNFADSTFLGMGRGAGNAATELLLALKSPKNSKISSFEINNLIEKIEVLKGNLKWGSSFSYAFAAREGYSQSKMMDLIQKRRLDPSIAVKAIINSQDNFKKINFFDINNLKNICKNTPLIIGGGPNFKTFGKFLLKQLSDKTPLILSGSRALKNFSSLNIKIKNPKIMLLSGNELKKIRVNNEKNIFQKLNINYFIAEKIFLNNNEIKILKKIVYSDSVAINPLLLAGLAVLKLNKKQINLAFFDGEFEDDKGKIVMRETQESVKYLEKSGIKFKTLTPTYLKVEELNPYT